MIKNFSKFSLELQKRSDLSTLFPSSLMRSVVLIVRSDANAR
ncbi:MAG: hypothetical protein ACOX3P_05920 [Saccharofermentanales bacterium]